MTLLEFGVLLGLYTKEEIDTDLYRLAWQEDFDDIISSLWPQISDSPWLGKARQQQQGDVRAAPAGAPLRPPPPPRGRRLVFRDPVLRDQSRRLDRLEDLVA
ncbi:hypothetical protein E3N88_15633 [Mikania micrantha]|uniref:Uncharacterized protein n=1 Tax=Mikania micrantha TaxID=192012 RepID=A0A5N6NY82_9ASTR|nr:hypothetical protein E3N88_15633 [Mikania micrantha]